MQFINMGLRTWIRLRDWTTQRIATKLAVVERMPLGIVCITAETALDFSQWTL